VSVFSLFLLDPRNALRFFFIPTTTYKYLIRLFHASRGTPPRVTPSILRPRNPPPPRLPSPPVLQQRAHSTRLSRDSSTNAQIRHTRAPRNSSLNLTTQSPRPTDTRLFQRPPDTPHRTPPPPPPHQDLPPPPHPPPFLPLGRVFRFLNCTRLPLVAVALPSDRSLSFRSKDRKKPSFLLSQLRGALKIVFRFSSLLTYFFIEVFL